MPSRKSIIKAERKALREVKVPRCGVCPLPVDEVQEDSYWTCPVCDVDWHFGGGEWHIDPVIGYATAH